MTINLEATINATPDAVFELLLNSEKFSIMTNGAPADISQEVGGKVSLFGDHVSARNIELSPGKRVVQTWRAKGWPEGIHSLIHFELSKNGDNSTNIVFTQSGHPSDSSEELIQGWSQMYWGPMNAMFAS